MSIYSWSNKLSLEMSILYRIRSLKSANFGMLFRPVEKNKEDSDSYETYQFGNTASFDEVPQGHMSTSRELMLLYLLVDHVAVEVGEMEWNH